MLRRPGIGLLYGLAEQVWKGRRALRRPETHRLANAQSKGLNHHGAALVFRPYHFLQIATASDFNGDGKQHLVLQNPVTGQLVIRLMIVRRSSDW